MITEVLTNEKVYEATEPIVTLIVAPGMIVVGAAAITGLVARDPSAFNRYGGVNISVSGWFAVQLPQRPPPAAKTRPSCRSTATL